MLSELCMRIGLQLDHVKTTAVLDSQNLDVDAASPVVPKSIFLAVDVNVWRSVLVGELVLRQLVVLNTLSLLSRHFENGPIQVLVILGYERRLNEYGLYEKRLRNNKLLRYCLL